MTIVGQIFFYENVNTDFYEWEFVEQLDDIELSQDYFQRGGAFVTYSLLQ